LAVKAYAESALKVGALGSFGGAEALVSGVSAVFLSGQPVRMNRPASATKGRRREIFMTMSETARTMNLTPRPLSRGEGEPNDCGCLYCGIG
jgi:hypothetical protein